MVSNEAKRDLKAAQASPTSEALHDELEQRETGRGNWRELLRIVYERARRQKPSLGRQELGRDKSKSFCLLVGTGAVLVVLFFGVFSRPRERVPLPGETPRGRASLGRKATAGQENNDPTKIVTPMLSADIRSSDPAPDRVTPEDVGRTSRTGSLASPVKPSATRTNYPQDYALSQVDFSDPLVGQGASSPPQPPVRTSSGRDQNADLNKPSLVFVRANDVKPAIQPGRRDDEEETLALPVGTRLVARLQASVSSAVATPVVAVVEYNYEHNGQIVLPAGAKAFGRLTQVNPSGYVGIVFNRVELSDGTSAKIEASAMDLNFGPLKGYVSGKRTGTKFLVRSLTGLGTVASYLVGPQASGSDEVVSTNTLMRERFADNVATAGQEQMNGLASTQNLVVTVPANTRFYIILQKSASDDVTPRASSRNTSTNTAGLNGHMPTLEELRQLIQLKAEINDLYTQANNQSGTQTQPQQ